GLLEFELKEVKARKTEQAVEVLRAEMRERAMKLGVSLEDLLAPALAGEVRKAAKGLLPAKYVNPDNPEDTWCGRGHTPSWLKDKLKAGHNKSEFAIKTNGAGAA